ncbi:hypothetical protein DEJ49_33060 [Streptomyces venezuelae]|uniref:Uncharacterized protein n=1 Tax=Streptomyces venezuelae TaxID=54571 RepID=A0A5P2CRZ8_STRVZ|nr:hypothetical protein [Streptomyces venezuelae]QES45173.1 hypothetical protein DEJ49_33060 [Streptomyces venezuelae]
MTEQHNVRVPKELWDAAMEEAKAEGTTVTAWINADLDKRVKAARRRRATEQRRAAGESGQ